MEFQQCWNLGTSNNELPDTGKNFSNHNRDGAGLTTIKVWPPYFEIAEAEQQSQAGKGQDIQVFSLEADSPYVLSADGLKMRYKNAHLKN